MSLYRTAILGLAWVLIAPGGAFSAAPAPTRIQPAKPNAAAVTFPQGADSALIAKLKEGGYVIFFRHAPTNWAERDVTEGDFENRVHQRNLSEVGQRVAVGTGMAVKVLEIPIEKVVSSPMWRCRDTAQFAFGDYDTTSLLFWKGAKFREARIQMLSTSPAAGKNLVLVGHQDQLIPIVPGLRRDELKEGDALVIRPLGKGKFKVVAQVTPADWMILAHVEPPTGDPLGSAPPAAPAAPPDSAKGSSRVDER